MNTVAKRRWRWLALVLSLAVAASAAGLVLSLRGESRAQSAAASPSTPAPAPGSTQAQADLRRMQALLNTGSVSAQVALLAPPLQFAPGSGPVVPPGKTIRIEQETLRTDGQFATVKAAVSDGTAVTLDLYAVHGHWRLYDVETGSAQVSVKVTYGLAAPPGAQLDSASGNYNFVPNKTQLGTRTPVILIHGWTGSPAAFGNAGDPSSMIAQVEAIPGNRAWAWAFDYSATSGEWVTNPNNGPAFAKYIYHVHEVSLAGHGSGKVIIVAYSMGGLLTRYAAGQTINGNRISDDISMVITMGTPNTGTLAANIGATAHRLVCNQTAGLPQGFCNEWTSLAGMSAYGSQISKLPSLPSSIPLHEIAGDEIYDVHVWNATIRLSALGDFVVPTWSAQYQRPGGDFDTYTVTNDPNRLFDFSAWHGNLSKNPQVIARVHSLVLNWIQAHPVTAPVTAPSPSTSQPTGNVAYWLAGGGRWYVHGITLQISQGPSGLTGTETWNEGPCDPANLQGVMCQGSASLAFTSQPNGSLAGTYTTDTTYTPSSGTSVGSFPGDPGAPQKGQTVLLEPVAPMHAQSVLGPDSPMMFSGGNLNLCQAGLPDASQYCGA